MASVPLVLGTRGSNLARWQAEWVQARLAAHGAPATLLEIRTTGDKITDVPLAKIGDKGLFTKELDYALLEGRIDLAVHSLKDLPTRLPEGIALAAVSAREEPWDAFVAHPGFAGDLDDAPRGAAIGTSSLRRQAQLLAWRPDLRIVSVRGNVETRLARLEASDWCGIILAAAGLSRLGYGARIRGRIGAARMIPAVSQGALGVVCRAADAALQEALRAAVHDAEAAACTRAERAFLRRLEGGCQAPIGAYAALEAGALRLQGCVADVDGSALLRAEAIGAPDAAEQLGVGLAETLLDRGAADILRRIRLRGPF